MLTLIHFFKVRQNVVRTVCLALGLTALVCLLNGCADDSDMATSATPVLHPSSDPRYQVNVEGGDTMMQQWTIDAVSAYCTHKVWPRSIRRIHRAMGVSPLFNQPRKTQVLVAPDNTLHIHFQLGGVLMDNYSHELIITAPRQAICASNPMHYEVTMQPNGDAVIYKSNPVPVASVST